MSERHWRLFVEDIIESIDKIETYVANMQFENFTQDSKTIDAVSKKFGNNWRSIKSHPR